MHTHLSALLALASAIAFAAAVVGQQRAAAESSDADARGGRFIGQLLRNPRWIAATLGNAVGYALQAAALGVGSVVVVAPVLVTSLLFALPLSARLADQRLTRSALTSGLVLSGSLSMFVILGHAARGVTHGSSGGWAIVAGAGLPLVVSCLVVAQRRRGSVRASLLAVAVGVLGGVLAVLTKSVVHTASGGVLPLLTSGETYGLIVIGLAGTYLQQLAFQAGALQNSLPIMTVLEPLVAAALGVSLLHEQLRAPGPRMIELVVAAFAMTTAAFVLARSQARVTTMAYSRGPSGSLGST